MNKKYKELKINALTLRKQGLSYGDIAKKLRISKSTTSYWLKNIELTAEQRKNLNKNQARHLNYGPKSSHERRQREIKIITEKAEGEISFPLKNETYKLFGAALYWAEGNKINDFTITNSDPLLIQFMCQWFCKIFSIKPEDLSAHLNIYLGQNDLEIKKFWSDITKIPLKNFGKSFIKPLNKNFKKNTLYYGTIKVRVNKGTNFRHRVFGWINKILKDNKQDIEKIDRKWYKLKAEYKRP